MSERLIDSEQLAQFFQLQDGQERSIKIPESEATLFLQPDRLVVRLRAAAFQIELTLSRNGSDRPQPVVKSAAAQTAREGKEQPNRVVLVGRVGRDPHLKTTAKGRLVAKMPLAVHEGDKTTWHTILFFDDKARKAADTLSKGQMVSIVGYRHFKEVPTKRGGTRMVEEIYAAALQKSENPPRSR